MQNIRVATALPAAARRLTRIKIWIAARLTIGGMKIHVQSHRAHGEDVPRGIRLGERFLPVHRVADRWKEGESRYFRVTVLDGRTFVLRQDMLTGRWKLARAAA